MARSATDAESAMVVNLKEKTGKSLDQWITVARKLGKVKHSEIVKTLKDEHGLTHGYANLIALKTLKSDAGSSSATDLVAAQYAGDKAALKPVYDAVIKAAQSFGETEIAPKKTYVSLRRSKQFAIVQPSTKTRVDLGLNMKGAIAAGRLEDSGGFNAMVTHRVRLEKASDVNKEVKAWLKMAWEKAG